MVKKKKYKNILSYSYWYFYTVFFVNSKADVTPMGFDFLQRQVPIYSH